MKRTIAYSMLFAFIGLWGSVTNVKAQGTEPAQVDGTYQIASFDNLIWFAAQVNGGSTTLNAVLTADISQGAAVYTPIGSTDHPYSGTFDGKYHSITLQLNNSAYDNQGIFGVITGGTQIRCLISRGEIYGKGYVGGIAGSSTGSGIVLIENCGNEAVVRAEWNGQGTNAAGILGCNLSGDITLKVHNCYNAGSISGHMDNGAIVGWAGNNAGSEFINCYNKGSVQADNSVTDFVRKGTAAITNCYHVYGYQGQSGNGTTEVTAAQLANGELRDGLNSNNGKHWYQNAEDAYPLPFDHLPANLNNYFFIISDHNNPDLGMVLEQGNHQEAAYKTMYYRADVEPKANKAALWTLMPDGDYKVIANVVEPNLMLQTEYNAAHFYHTHDNGGGNLYWGDITPVYDSGDGCWTIQNGKYPEEGYLGPWDGAGHFEDGAEVALNKTGDAIGHFDILSMPRGQYVKLAESEKAQSLPVDITYIITNPDFEGFDLSGWAGSNDFQKQGNDALGNKHGATYFEAYQDPGNNLSGRTLSQAFTNMPAGHYVLTVKTNVTATGAFLYINNVQQDLSTKSGGVASVAVDITEGATLTIGVKLDNYQSNWVAFDDFHLYYSNVTETTALPTDLNDYFFSFYDHSNPHLGLVLGQGNHQGNGNKTMYYSEACSPMTDKASLWTMVDHERDGNHYNVITNVTEPEYMLQTEDNAAYLYHTHDNGGGDASWGDATFDYAATGWTIQNGKYPEEGYLGPWDGMADGSVDAFYDGSEIAFNKTGDAIGHFDIFKIKRGKYVELVETSKSEPTDISYILNNAEATQAGVLGWTLSGAGVFERQNNNYMTNKSGDYYFQYWQANGTISDRQMSQTFTEMPAGQYTLRVKPFVEGHPGAILFINGVEKDLTDDVDGIVSVSINLAVSGSLTIGVKLNGYTSNWVAFDDFQLEYTAPMTKLPAANELNDYFYSFRHHADPTLGLVLGDGIAGKQDAGSKTMLYSSNCDPLTNKNALWTMVEFENKNVIASPMYPEFMLQTEGGDKDYYFHTSDNGGGGLGWGKAKFTQTDGSWTIQNGYYEGDRYLGPWDGADHFEDNAIVAFNKNGTATGHFDIFKIKRGEYVSKVETEKAKRGPVDISYIITNAEATRRNTVGWTLSGDGVFDVVDYASMTNKSGNYFFEKWQAGGGITDRKISQTFTDMPDGQYTLSILTTNDRDESGAYLFINDEKAEFTSRDANGVVTVVANVTGGILSIGVELKGYRATTDWVCFDKFELTWSLAKPQVGAGRYILKNCGRKCYLKHGTGENSDKTAASLYFGGRDAAWDFVPSAYPDQYYIRNVDNGKYLQWSAEENGNNLPLVADPLDASLFSFDTAGRVHEGCICLRVKGAPENYPYLNAFGVEGQLGTYAKDDPSDWILFPVSEPLPEEGVDYLIINKESGNYATRQDADNASLLQNTQGEVDDTRSVWTLATSGTGYTMACGGNNLAALTGITFTAAGATWHIKKVCTDISHVVISTAADLSGTTCWHNNGGNAIDSDVNSDPASRWRFIPVEEYYQNALAYLSSLYDEDKKNKPFYLSETVYNNLKTAAHGTAAEKITAANAMFHVLDNPSAVLNMPQNNTDYLIRNKAVNNMHLHTNETNIILQDNPYNSTYFWHAEKATDSYTYRLNQCCYDPSYDGAQPLRYNGKRYIADTQPNHDTDQWVYEASQETYPISFELRETRTLPLLGSAMVLVNGNRMNLRGAQVFTWNNLDEDNNKWEFVTVEEASAPLIATAESVYEAGNNGPFTLTAEAKEEIRTAIDNLKNEYNYQNYWILENLLNNPTSFATLADGRYLVRNYNYDYTRDGYPEDTETYLTALTNTMGVVEEALNYWSIWDVKKTADGYTMQCEGNSLVHAPGHPLDGNPNTDERDNGFLYYAGIHDGNDQYWVGNTAEQTLYINPAFSLQLGNVDRPLVGSYASISSKEHPSKYLYQWTVGIGNWIDNVVYAQEYQPNNNNAAWKTAFLWEFIPLTAEKEAEIFQNQVDGLAGYVGGVVTLTDVESVPCLQDIVDLRDAAVTAIKNGTTLAYTAPAGYDNLTVNDASQVGPQAYRAILDKINDIKRNPETKKYYQDLRPTETLDNGKEVKHPFFMENFSGTRPSYGARLTEGDGNAWLTRPKNEVVDKAGAFYVTRTRNELIDANGIVTQEAQYQLLNGNGYSLDHRSNTPGEHFSINRTLGNDKMTFEIEPVIPGVWKMRDAEVVAGAWPYVTVTAQYGMSGGLQYYNRVEVSTLWKFQTFNELDTIFVRVAPTATTDGNYFCTYSNTLSIEVPVANNPVPYYCSAAYYHKANEDAQTSTALKVVLTQMPNDGTNYYLKHDAGYLFMTKSGTNINEVGDPLYNPSYPNAVFIADAKYMTGSIEGFIAGDNETRRPAYEDNLFVGNAKWPIEITPANWSNIYALGYAAGNTQVGIYHGTPVWGRGMGFYHIKLGGVLKAGSAYIPSKAFSDEDGDFTPISALEVHESGMPVEILFEDEEGNMVDCIEFTSDGTMKHMSDGPIYDLTGRQVAKPGHGIYIQNGRKVYYK